MVTFTLNTDATTEHTLIVDYHTHKACVVHPFIATELSPEKTQKVIRFRQSVAEVSISEPDNSGLVVHRAILFQGHVQEESVQEVQRNNIMVGYGAGGETVGGDNCFIGNDTNVAHGRRNIVIGHGNRLVSGTNNVIIGHHVSENAEYHDKLKIGSLIEGDFASGSVSIHASLDAPAFTDGFLSVTRGNLDTGNVSVSADVVHAPEFTDGFLTIHKGNLDTGNVSISANVVHAPEFTDGFLTIHKGNLDTGNVSISANVVHAPEFTDGFLTITRGEIRLPEENVAFYFDNGAFKYRYRDKVYRLSTTVDEE
jgi:hypothetical protein